MRILHISKYYPPYKGGIEDVCFNLVNGIEDCEHQVICFNNKINNEYSFINGVRVFRAGIVKEIARQPISLSFYSILKSCLKDFSPEIIHLHLPNPLVCLYILLLKKKNVKLVIHWHSDIIVKRYIYILFKPIEERILEVADRIIVTSPNYMNSSVPLSSFKSKCVVIPNMISIEKLSMDNNSIKSVRELQSTYKNKKIIFFIGRHVPYKGLEYLLDAEKYIKSDCVILISGNGPLTSRLESRVLSQRVKFIGRISDEDIKIYMRAAVIFAFPSITKNEAFGVALAEAMYCKAVPVTFAIEGSGVNWVNLNGITGIEVENRNSQQFGEAIEFLLKNECDRSRYAENAYNRVVENFTMNTVKKQVEDLYKSL